jgi:uncharacterized membrane protein YagU involved in acid resistance
MQKPQWRAGILGSLAGGLIFGIMMAMMGMLTMIANMVGSHSAIVGLMVHLMISLIFGVVFSLFTAMMKGNRILHGILFGVVLWFLSFIMMPLMHGMAPFTFTSSSMMSLVGHMVYGLVTGWVYKVLEKKSTEQKISGTV